MNLDSSKTILNELFFKEAAKIAEKSTCKKDKCGAVVVLENEIIGSGYNGPVGKNVFCNSRMLHTSKPKSDRTCCVHAEWRAILEAVSSMKPLEDATLYFTRVGAEGEILLSGEPYCTVCSRLALESGIGYFALWQEAGMKVWTTEEYNLASYDFHLKNTR